MRGQSIGFVQVVAILSFPAKGLALLDFESSNVNAFAFQKKDMLLGKIFSDDRNKPDLGKIAG